MDEGTRAAPSEKARSIWLGSVRLKLFSLASDRTLFRFGLIGLHTQELRYQDRRPSPQAVEACRAPVARFRKGVRDDLENTNLEA